MWNNFLHYFNPNININVSIIFIFLLSYFLDNTFRDVSNLSVRNDDIIEEGDVHQVSIVNSDKTLKSVFNKNSSILFIGGVPKSGTTLMRILLDIHSKIRYERCVLL